MVYTKSEIQNINKLWLKDGLSKQGKTQAGLAEAVDASKQAVTKWLKTGQIAAERIAPMARYLEQAPPEWMMSVETEGKESGAVKPTVVDAKPSNTASGPEARGLLPLISWVQAGEWHQAEDHFLPGDAEEWLPCPASHGLNSYALKVKGDSMTATHGKSYPDGCIIYVDPDQVASNGDRVIAKINGDDEVTFKQLVIDGGKTFLKPLNPQHPIITDKFRVLGKVIAKYEPE